MKRKLVWAFPAIFAVSALVGLATANAGAIANALANVAEGIKVTDSITVLPPLNPSPVSEQIKVQDSPSVLGPVNASPSEAIKVQDAVQVLGPLQINVPETIKVLDTLPRDMTPPTVTFSSPLPANPTKLGSATFTWTVTDLDDTSGFAVSCSLDAAPFSTCSSGVSYTALTESTHTFKVHASDLAGNLSSDASYSWIVDATGPAVQCPAADGNWHGSDVTFTCTASDGGSGLANSSDSSFRLSTTVAAGTETQSASTGSHQVCDRAGNCATGGPIAGNRVDKKAPTISTTAITLGNNQPYSGGTWTKQTVKVSFGCTDGGSGVDSVPADQTLAGDGANQSASGLCSDKVGNASTTSFGNIDIDKTAPTIAYTGQIPAANSAGWNSGAVTLTWSCSDSLSGVVADTVSMTIMTPGANQSATGTCTDLAGNTASNTRSGINIDQTPPSPSFSSQPGALSGRPLVTVNTNVAVTPGNVSFGSTCYDSFGLTAVLSGTDSNGSGVAAIKYGSAKMVAGQPLPNPSLGTSVPGSSANVSFSTSGAYVLNYAAVDNAGNQGPTQTRWIFVNSLVGVSCATNVVPVASLPSAGTATISGTIQIGTLSLPFSFSFSYPSKS